jgi:hypothetical protein
VATIAAQLPWVVNTGLRTVPANVPVLLLAKCGDELDELTGEWECVDQTEFSWVITGSPANSTAVLTDADTQSPWFTPDRVGTYRIQETNGSGADLEIHVGRYRGVIDPVATLDSVQFGDGWPVADESCTGCHDGGEAPDNFTPWRQTGHAEAFTQGITTNDHFGERCFACHAVGFGKDNAGGIDDTPNYANFMNLLASNQASGDIAGTWETMLMQMPDTARVSNIQCENCHGPQDFTEAHRDQPGAPRVSIASDVCGSCHGEPARHGRFQQWQLSNHADYDLARERGLSTNCGRCHSGNGFVDWSKHDFDPTYTPASLSWDAESVQPQTCAACHDPHDTGSTSGSDETNAKVRIMGDTAKLLAGFKAISVGKGATCMTCHNSRADVPRNDATWNSLSDSQKTGTPHHGVQADLIMGQNAYFMDPGELNRGKHSLIQDVCVTCHMNKTQPPDILSYNQAGTNHTFAADPNVCSECHGSGGVTADTVGAIINSYLVWLQDELGAAYQRLMVAHYPVDITDCGTADEGNPITDVVWNMSRGVRLDITVNGTTCTGRNPSNQVTVTVDGGAQSLQTLSLAPGNDDLLKALWNYGLLFEDSDPVGRTARGVHNPDFSMKALYRAIAAVQAVSP